MLRNIIGPLNFKNVFFLLFVFGLFFKTPLLSAGRTRFLKNKNQKKNKTIGPLLTLKGQKLDHFLTLQHIYMYIYLPPKLLKIAFSRGFIAKNGIFRSDRNVSLRKIPFFVINPSLVQQHQSLSPSMGHRNSTYSTFPLKGTHFLRNVLLSGEMLNMLNPGGACWIRMCLKLQKCWICWICWMFLGELEERGGLAKFSPKHSTYSTFPLKGTHFLRNVLLSGEMLNMLNPGGHVESKCA